jgi:tetratricopeptide (TPR) repeat protein
MQRQFAAGRLALVLGLCLSVVACSQFGSLAAKKHFKDANALYQRGEYRKAAEAYEQVVASDPNLTVAYFYLGNSYDQLYKPSRAGEAENDGFIQKAIANYEKAAQLEQEPKMKKLALQYLVAAYGPDKLNDPEKAEPLIKKMIELDPNDPDFYFALVKMYEDSGRYDDAEAVLADIQQKRPNDPAVWMQTFAYHNRQGEFEKSFGALKKRMELDPNNPEAYFFTASVLWEKSFKDATLTDAQKKDYAQQGLDAVDKAISLNPNYMEAVTYRGLLLRVQAALEKDAGRQKALLTEAEKMQAQAKELQKKKAAGVS